MNTPPTAKPANISRHTPGNPSSPLRVKSFFMPSEDEALHRTPGGANQKPGV